ncbi:MAG: hypothetical protein H7834_09015 [Magnetococcus sp. YQC-9]
MQKIEIEADITPEGNIRLPSPLKNFYGRQARLILMVDEIASAGEAIAEDPLQTVAEQLREDPTGEHLMQEMDKVWNAWQALSGEADIAEAATHANSQSTEDPGGKDRTTRQFKPVQQGVDDTDNAVTPLNANWYQELLVSRIQARLPEVLAIYAMGEQIEKGSGTLGVPLELAVLLEAEADPVAMASLARELSALAHCWVELLDLRVSSTIIQYQVVTTGERWWSSNPRAGLFECFVLHEKSSLDESRPSPGSPRVPMAASCAYDAAE